MEKLLNVISKELKIRFIEKEEKLNNISNVIICLYTYEDTNDEVKRLFKKELRNHIFEKLENQEVGEFVEYMFDWGDFRPLGSIMEDANDNLAEVLQKLPKLPENAQYVFPIDTYFCLTVTDKSEDKSSLTSSAVSEWISKAYFMQ